MKKTRIIASLLCIMMVVCALPMMASAAVPAKLQSALATVFSTSNAIPAKAAQIVKPYWEGMNLDFTDNFNPDDYAESYHDISYGLTEYSGITFDNENGAVFPAASKATMKYKPANPATAAYDQTYINKNGDADGRILGWSPLAISGSYSFGFKLNEGGTLVNSGEKTWANLSATMSFTNDAVTVNNDKNVTYSETPYKPGTEWNDVLVKTNSGGGYDVLMKKASEDSFVTVATTTSFDGGGTWKTGKCKFEGKNCSVNYAVTFKGANVVDFESIDEIVGGPTGSTYSLIFDENSNFANTSDNSADGLRDGYWTTDGYKSDSDGVTLIDSTATSKEFVYGPFSNYTPLNSQTVWVDPTDATKTPTYSPQALYLKAKGGFELRIAGPNNRGRLFMISEVGKDLGLNACSTTFSFSNIIQDEWTEYLIVPNGREKNTNVTDQGASLYVKAESTTGGKWFKVKEITFGNTDGNYSGYKITLRGVTGHVKEIRTISLDESISDIAATPVGADFLYYSEEFDQTPSYSNFDTQGVVDNNGNLLFPTTKGSMDFKLNGLEIPVGGYIEFKVQYDCLAQYYFYDGEKAVSVSQQSDYGSFSGGTGYTGNNNTSWRTWRFVRNADGTYNGYSKNEGDTGWFIHGLNVNSSSNKAPMVHFNFGRRNGSTEANPTTGESKIAYLKVYGPAPTSALTVTDGYTATPVADGATLAYPASLRAIATPDAGKLLVVSYKGNDMAKAQIVNVADMADDSVFVDATAEGADSVKVFLWDGFNGLNRLAPVVTFGL